MVGRFLAVHVHGSLAGAVGAQALFVLPRILALDALSEVEHRFLVALRRLLKPATGRRLHLELGDFGGPQTGRQEALFVEGPRDGRVFQRPESSRLRLPARVRRRCMLINRHHDYFQLQLAASVDDLALASFSLAQVLLTDEDAEGEGTYVKLLTAAIAALP